MQTRSLGSTFPKSGLGSAARAPLPALALALALATGAAGCGKDGKSAPPTGELRLVTVGLADDVAGILYEIECENGESITQYVPLEDEGLPGFVDPDLAGNGFADLFSTLSPGKCTVTATAMLDPNTPAEGCEPVTQTVVVKKDKTTEVVMEIDCGGGPVGALDVVVVVTDGLTIVDLDYDDSKFIVQCEEVNITVEAEGGEGPLTYTFVVTSAPAGAVYTMSSTGGVLTFFAETPGTYQVTVTVTDGTSTATLTFPIHVSDDPDIEHCDEVCCQLPDGHVFYGTGTACEEAGGVSVTTDLCDSKLCCKTPTGPAIVPASDCPQGAVLPAAECEVQTETCCRLQDGSVVFVASAGDCTEMGGVLAPFEQCTKNVCCKLAAPTIVPAVDCPGPQVLPPSMCAEEEVCCQVQGQVTIQTAQDCHDQGGAIVNPELCQPEVCCLTADGTYQTLPQSTCKQLGGAVVGDDLCKEICCKLQGAPLQLMTADECKAAGGVQVADAECDELQTFVWQAEYTLDPDDACDPAPYLVVPSSGANQLAVYDTTTLTPLTTTPFNTCSNPSRIMMDANTDCYATCRGDGKVNKHTRDGVLIWSTQLPACFSSRGVAMSGNGRLFAGCSDFGQTVMYELDPATGAVLNSVNVGYAIYGLAVDADGVYVASYFTSHVIKVYLGGANDMTVAWTVSQQAYGITVDQVGRVWVGGSFLVALSTLDGSVVDSTAIPITLPSSATTNAWTHGVMAGLDGNIYGATMQGVVYRYDPIAQTDVDWVLHPGANGNRGVTLDAANNIYSINLSTNDLTRTTPAGVPTGFGDDAGTVFLVNPYGYSGDMTGLTNTCIAGTTSAWFSSQLDSGSPTTLWQTISWTATTPPGSAVSVYYSIDGGTTYTLATNGQVLNVVAQVFQVKALLQSTIAGNEPTIHNITITYQ